MKIRDRIYHEAGQLANNKTTIDRRYDTNPKYDQKEDKAPFIDYDKDHTHSKISSLYLKKWMR